MLFRSSGKRFNKDVTLAILAGFTHNRRVMVQGLHGTGKSTHIEQVAARLNLAYTKVTAPISGRVSKAEITAGNLVDTAAVLTSVVSTKNIYASFDGDESTFQRVSKQAHDGKAVAVHVGLVGEEGFPHQGKLGQ